MACEKLREIRSDFVDDNGVTHIDGYTTDDEDVPGFNVVLIARHGTITFWHEDYREDREVQKEVQAVRLALIANKTKERV